MEMPDHDYNSTSTESENLIRFMSLSKNMTLSEAVIEKTKHHIVDTVAAIISGHKLEVGKRALSVVPALEGKEQASVLGTNFKLSTYSAAMVNAMLAHADETDDSHEKSKFHPGCGIVPAAFAIAEHQRATGADVIRAVALGYDVGARILEALGPMPLNNSGHASHAFGPIFGCGAAAGCLLGFDQERTRHLLSYLAHEASGLFCWMADTDHIQKAFVFGGMAAKNALYAALLCQHDWTGPADVVAGRHGILQTFGNAEHGRTLAEPFVLGDEILRSDIKKWCVASAIQPPLDSLTKLLPQIPEDVGEIQAVEVEIQANEVFMVSARNMPNISLQHVLAVFLVDRGLTFASVHDASRMEDAAVRAVRSKVNLIPNLDLQRAGGRQAIVRVILSNGTVLTDHTPATRGTWRNAMTRMEVEQKAKDLLEPVIGKSQSCDLLDGLWKLEMLTADGWIRLIKAVSVP
jgi:2-methylcitrate dehydratase PrpD